LTLKHNMTGKMGVVDRYRCSIVVSCPTPRECRPSRLNVCAERCFQIHLADGGVDGSPPGPTEKVTGLSPEGEVATRPPLS